MQVGMICIQRRFKLVCVSMQSYHSLSFAPEETLNPWSSIERPSRTLVKLEGCAGYFESLVGAQANLYPLLDTDLFVLSLKYTDPHFQCKMS